MSRKLDFIVAGVARTGTTAIARYLSAIETCHCGVELFSPNEDHSVLLAPDCFTELSDPANANRARAAKPRHAAYSLGELQRKGNRITVWGNKTPNYFHRLQGIMDELAGGKGILAWRKVRETAMSFQRRSTNPNDNFFDGRNGLYAALDMMLITRVVVGLTDHDLMIVPNGHLVADWEGSMRTVATYIAPDTPVVFENMVVEDLNAAKDRKTETREASDIELTRVDEIAVRFVEKSGLDTLFDRPGPFLLSKVRSDLIAVLNELPPNLLRFAELRSAAHSNPAVAEYFPKWQKHAQSVLDSIPKSRLKDPAAPRQARSAKP